MRISFGLDHETITQLAEKEAAGSSGVNFLPYITGERTPNWPHSSGVLTGLRPGSMRPGLLYRAAMEGATFSLLAGQQWASQTCLKGNTAWYVGRAALISPPTCNLTAKEAHKAGR